jgi:hypothetical protein
VEGVAALPGQGPHRQGQHAVLATHLDAPELHVLGLRDGLVAVERIVRRERQRDVGQREHRPRPGELERPRHLLARAGGRAQLLDLHRVRRHIGDYREPERPLRHREQPLRQRARVVHQQLLDHRVPVHVEQHQLVVFGGEVLEQCVDHGFRAHRRVHGGEKREHRREALDQPAVRQLQHAARDARSEPVRLAGRVERERVVLVRIELGLDDLPRGPSEAGHGRQSRPQLGDGGEARDADRRREEHEAGWPRQRLTLEHRERVVDRQRRAVRVANHVDRQVGTGLTAQVDHRHAHGRLHVLDAERDEARRRGAVARQPEADHLEAARREMLADRAQAVGRVREAVQQQDRAAATAGLRCGLQVKAAIPVHGPDAGIAAAAGPEPVERFPVAGSARRIDPLPQFREQAVLELAVIRQRGDPGGVLRREVLQGGLVPGHGLGPAAQEVPVQRERDQRQAEQRTACGKEEPAHEGTDHSESRRRPRKCGRR